MEQDGADDQRTIDEAIEACTQNIRHHRWNSMIVLSGVLGILGLLFWFAIQYSGIEAQALADSRIQKLYEIKSLDTRIQDERRQISEERRRSFQREYLASLNKEFAALSSDQPNKEKEDKIKAQIADAEKRVKREDEDLDRRASGVDKKELELKDLQAQFQKEKPLGVLSPNILLGMVATIALIVGVFTSLYRFHLREITKNEQYKIGFLRVRIAANNNDRLGFQTEVRKALADGAFDFLDGAFSRTRKIESPLPGHPTSDIVTNIVNRIFEEIELALKSKRKD
jgi:hypothetical protein